MSAKYTLWNMPRSEWTSLPKLPPITPELAEKIRLALEQPMTQEELDRLKPYQGNSYFY